MSRRILLVAMALLLVTAMVLAKGGKYQEKRNRILLKKKAPEPVQKRQACQPTEFRCSSGRCVPGFKVCDTHKDCPAGDDENGCPTDCNGPNQVKCVSDGKCVGLIDKCDGYQDCRDYTDEAYCQTFACPDGRFHCGGDSGECISSAYVCDHDYDCEDGSDEKNCPSQTCSSSQFKCNDGTKCVPQFYKCDGDNDCLDHSDENGCSCTSSQFKCPNGPCIPQTYVCDHDNDCGDLADEINCPSSSAGSCGDVLTFEDCFRMNQTTHPICLVQADGRKFCRKFCGLCT